MCTDSWRHPCAQDDALLTSFAIVLSFMMGAFLSAAAGWWGMMVATDGNAKTTAACAGDKTTGKRGSLNEGLKVWPGLIGTSPLRPYELEVSIFDWISPPSYHLQATIFNSDDTPPCPCYSL